MDELNSISGAEAAGIAPIEVRRQQVDPSLFQNLIAPFSQRGDPLRVCDVQPIPATIASFLFRSLPPGICNCTAGSCPPNGQPPLGGPYYCTGCMHIGDSVLLAQSVCFVLFRHVSSSHTHFSLRSSFGPCVSATYVFPEDLGAVVMFGRFLSITIAAATMQ